MTHVSILQAILTHKGRSSNSGHYVGWVKHKADTWIECNDDDVRPVHVDDVMKLSGGGEQYKVDESFGKSKISTSHTMQSCYIAAF